MPVSSKLPYSDLLLLLLKIMLDFRLVFRPVANGITASSVITSKTQRRHIALETRRSSFPLTKFIAS